MDFWVWNSIDRKKNWEVNYSKFSGEEMYDTFDRIKISCYNYSKFS